MVHWCDAGDASALCLFGRIVNEAVRARRQRPPGPHQSARACGARARIVARLPLSFLLAQWQLLPADRVCSQAKPMRRWRPLYLLQSPPPSEFHLGLAWLAPGTAHAPGVAVSVATCAARRAPTLGPRRMRAARRCSRQTHERALGRARLVHSTDCD
jgi:hypothetical protein